MTTRKLTEEVKSFAINEGADLVGIAPVDRFKNAPLLISPQGHLPEAESVIVAAVHIPDGCIEFSGVPRPEMVGPYVLTAGMIFELNSIGFKMAKFLEEKGYQAIPISCTMFFRIKALQGDGLNTAYLPDLSHIHAAAAAGLGEIGYSGLLLTPEYGPRQRFVSVITDAFLEPDPMYDGPPLCDRCMECTRYCPSGTYIREVEGLNKVEIGGKIFKYAKINKLRCGWRHDLNMDPQIAIPEKIDEKIVRSNVQHLNKGYCCPGTSCLRHCMSPHLRYKDSQYSHFPRRKRQFEACSSLEMRSITEKARALVVKAGADLLSIISFDKVKDLNLEQIPPDTKSIIIIAIRIHYEREGTNILNPLYRAGTPTIYARLMFIGRKIISYLEQLGYTSLPWEPLKGYVGVGQELTKKVESQRKNIIESSGLAHISRDKELITSEYGKRQEFYIVATSAPLIADDKVWIKEISPRKSRANGFLKEKLRKFAFKKGADLFGVASPERVNQVVDTLRKDFSQPSRVIEGVINRSNWQGKIEYKKVEPKKPRDYLPQVKSIIVIGVAFPDTVLNRALEPPSQAVGPYGYVSAQALTELTYIALDISRFLEDSGYKAIPAVDICGMASKTLFMHPLVDITANRYAAVCAGLGEFGWHGAVLTPQHGVRQRFVSIVTNAFLEPDDLYKGPSLCKRCFRCVESCPTNAFNKKEEVTLKIDDKTFRYGRVDRERCDWSKRYGLVSEVGPEQRGSLINVRPPGKITSEKLLQALNHLDPILLGYLCVVEKCLKDCSAKGMYLQQ